MKINKLLIFIIFVMIVTNILFLYFLYEPNIEVYKITHTINERDKLQKGDYELFKIPKSMYNEKMCNSENNLDNYYVKNNFTLTKDTILLKDMIETEEEMIDHIHRKLKEDEVNFDLSISDLKGNFNHLDKGMNVDLYLTIKDSKLAISDLFISNVLIDQIYNRDGFIIKNNDNTAISSFTIKIKKDYVSFMNEALKIGELSFVVNKNTYDELSSSLNNDSKLMSYFSKVIE